MDRISAKWESGRVLQLNMSYPVVQDYASQLNVERTPTFILFDRQGQEMQRWVGSPPDLDELPRKSS